MCGSVKQQRNPSFLFVVMWIKELLLKNELFKNTLPNVFSSHLLKLIKGSKHDVVSDSYESTS